MSLDTYPLITVKALGESRDFFTRFLGMSLVFEADWVVMLARTGGGPIALGLMTANHPSRPPGPEAFDGKGMILTFQVEDAAAEHKRLLAAGAPIVYGLAEEPWGQRRLMLRDPSDILVDVVEQIEPAAGFWDKYISREPSDV
ncbi:MAG: VOC family protein [Hyphomonadaceae bacterium]|nr:VOC family protein [Hyphomonadaceae bacterium]